MLRGEYQPPQLDLERRTGTEQPRREGLEVGWNATAAVSVDSWVASQFPGEITEA
jgi:hypothetical protein